MPSPERAIPQIQPDQAEQEDFVLGLQQNIDGFVRLRQSAQRDLANALNNGLIGLNGLDESIAAPLRARIETLDKLIQRRRDELKELFGSSAQPE